MAPIEPASDNGGDELKKGKWSGCAARFCGNEGPYELGAVGVL